MDLDLAMAALVSLFATLLPHYQTLPLALCKAVESMETAEGGASNKMVGGAIAAATAACWLVRSRRCASYTMLCLLAMNTGAMLASKCCSVENARSRFTLPALPFSLFTLVLSSSFAILALYFAMVTFGHYLFRTPHRNEHTYTCPHCASTNGVFVNPCGHCNRFRPPYRN